MDLLSKSDENLDLAGDCERRDKFCTSSTGRVYYAVYQRMKRLLVREKFDYVSFLGPGIRDQRPFSHQTIKAAFSKHISQTRPGVTRMQVAAQLAPMSQLYGARLRADYEDGPRILASGLRGYLKLARTLIAYIDGI